jgi:hypothetical protein
MKTYSRLIPVIILMILLVPKVWAREEYTKIINKEYPVNPDAQLVLDNRFGTIHCNNWDKNVISVEVRITVTASSEETAKKLLDMVTISASGSASLVEVKTSIAEGGFKGRTKVNIDYNVNMPVTISLDLTNKFGDVFINEVGGKVKLNLAYGNMEVNKLANSDNLLDIKFSKVNIKFIKGAVVLLKYSDLELDYAGSLRLDSKYSNLTANKIIALNVNFEGGKLDMENSSAVDSKSKFSDLGISRIEKSLNLDIQYGNCDVTEIAENFNNITIENKYGAVSVGIPDNASYSLDAELRYCDLDFPEDHANFTEKIITNTSKSYKATVGKEKNPVAKVTVRSEYGNVSFE